MACAFRHPCADLTESCHRAVVQGLAAPTSLQAVALALGDVEPELLATLITRLVSGEESVRAGKNAPSQGCFQDDKGSGAAAPESRDQAF